MLILLILRLTRSASTSIQTPYLIPHPSPGGPSLGKTFLLEIIVRSVCLRASWNRQTLFALRLLSATFAHKGGFRVCVLFINRRVIRTFLRHLRYALHLRLWTTTSRATVVWRERASVHRCVSPRQRTLRPAFRMRLGTYL